LLTFLPRYTSSFSVCEVLAACWQLRLHAQPALTLFGTRITLYRSASDALYAYLRKHCIQGTILVPAYTCERVVSALVSAGCSPVFVDVDRATGVMTSAGVEAFRGETLAAVLVTHLFGYRAQLERIVHHCRTHNIKVIEDAALAPPAVVHAASQVWPQASLVSFGKGKLFSLGYGGMLIEYPSKDTESETPLPQHVPNQDSSWFTTLTYIARLVGYASPLWTWRLWLVCRVQQLLGYHRRKERFQPERVHGESLPNTITRLVAHLLTPEHITRELTHRNRIGRVYHEQIHTNDVVRKLPIGDFDKFITPSYPLFCQHKHELHTYLARRGFDTGLYFNYCIGQLLTQDRFPNGEHIAEQIVLLPTHMHVTEKKAIQLANWINKWASTLESHDVLHEKNPVSVL
jgi:dTDP-4-amino-4,6-dideoxygalactose transaminase